MKDSEARGYRVALFGVLTIATVLRLVEFLELRSLWVDEAMLALGIGRLSFAGLTGALPYDQVAPVLFLWSLKAVTLLGGMSESSLRVLPFLAGIATPWLVWRTAKPLVGADAAIVATTLTALSPMLIRYSAEVKPYGMDAFITVAIVALTLRVREQPAMASSWWKLLVGGVVAMAASITAPFAVAGACVALALDSKVRSAPDGWKRIILLGAGTGVAFSLLLVLLYLPSSQNDYLRAYWSESFIDLRAPDFSTRVRVAVRAVTSAFPTNPESIPTVLLMAFPPAAVLLAARRQGLAAGALIGFPLIALAVGAVVTRLPVAARLFLFLAPLIFIACGVLIVDVLRLARLTAAQAAATGTVLVAAWGASALVAAQSPPANSFGRDAARLIAAATDSVPVYVFPGALPGWAFYSTDWNDPDTTRLDHFAMLGRATGAAPLNSLLPQSANAGESMLVYRGRRRIEIIGGRTPWGFIEPRGTVGGWGDSSWVTREADRLLSLAAPGSWLFGSHLNPQVRSSILRELHRRGVRVSTMLEQDRSLAARIELPLPQ